MVKHIIISTCILFIIASAPAIGQNKHQKIEKKIIVIEKESTGHNEINIDVNGSSMQGKSDRDISIDLDSEIVYGKAIRQIKLTIRDDAEERIVEWEDQGEIPSEIHKLMEEQGVDVRIINNADEKVTAGNNINVTVSKNEKKGIKERTIEVGIEADGEHTKLRWQDDGTIPEEIQKQLDELGINFNEHLGHLEHDSDDHIFFVKSDDNGLIADRVSDQGIITEHRTYGEGKLKSDTTELLKEAGVYLDETNDGTKGVQNLVIHKSKNGDLKTTRWTGNGEAYEGMEAVLKKCSIVLSREKPARAKIPQLGVGIDNHEAGSYITEVLENTAAAEAGIKAGDVITHVNDRKVSPWRLQNFISLRKVGERIKISILRDGVSSDITAILQERQNKELNMTNRIIIENKKNQK